MSDARKRIYLFYTAFRACSTPFKECRVYFQIKIDIEKNIFRSVENVSLDTVIAYKKNGVKHSFLENYD